MKLAILFVILLVHSAWTEKVVVCYYGTWATYRHSLGKFDVGTIKSELCTHLVYAFVGINDAGTVINLDAYLDLPDNYGRDNFGLFNALKQNNPELKTLLAVGGYNEGSAKYSKMAADPNLRKAFIESSRNMLLAHGFDGLDLDWEYPAQRDSTHGSADVENLTQLLKELKEDFVKHGLMLTIAVAAVQKSASLSYDVAGISQYVDYIHLMCYDFHGSWDSVTGHNAGLYLGDSEQNVAKDMEFTVDASVQYWLSKGAPPEKLVLGMPLYGRTFALSSATQTGVGAPISGPGTAGPYTMENGFMGYNELCVKMKETNKERLYDESAMVPYTILDNNNWLSYDDPSSLTLKVEYALKHNLAGAMVWSLETDDFNGLCGDTDFPLMRAINEALGRNVGDGLTTQGPSSSSSLTTAGPSSSTSGSSSSSSTTTVAPIETTSSPSSSTTSPSTSTTSPSTSTSSSTSTTSPSTSTTSPSTSTSSSTSTTSPSSSTTSPSTSTTSPSTSTTSSSSSTTNPNEICTTEGFTSNPDDCSSYYICVNDGKGGFTEFSYKCPNTLHWDQSIMTCNYAYLVNCHS